MEPETSPQESPDTDTEQSLGGWLVWLAFQAFGYCFTIAFLGMFAAFMLGFLENGISKWAWVGGALLAAIGYPMGWVRIGNANLSKLTKSEQEAEERKIRTPLNPVKGGVAGLFIGALLGAIVGAVIIVFWLSFQLSPVGALDANVLDAGQLGDWPKTALIILAWSAGIGATGFCLAGLLGRLHKVERNNAS